VPPDSSATKARILVAARAEFAQFGLAGARVDRIAAAAKANKRSIYVYFGSKEELFDTVIERCLASAAEDVPFDPADVTSYAARLFDYFVANPETLRLTTWNQLERGESSESSSEVYREMVRGIAAAQRRGEADSVVDPLDLIALVMALARAWFVASPALRGAGSDDPWSPGRLAKHRAAIVQAVASIVGSDRRLNPTAGESVGDGARN
jgi:AcrR family transcriptional regulator